MPEPGGAGRSSEAIGNLLRGPQNFVRSNGGLGLGLALVKGVVELHGGTVAADTVACGGAVFVIVFPLPPGRG